MFPSKESKRFAMFPWFPLRGSFKDSFKEDIVSCKGWIKLHLEYFGLCSPRDFLWAPSMGTDLFQRDLKYGPWSVHGL